MTALVLLGQLPAVAGADSLLSMIIATDTSEGWSPGPIDVVEAMSPAWEDEVENEFIWAGDRELGLLMSFDPDDEEVFIGWQIEF
ncbi:MAG: hypothetical protein Q8N51_16510 [Gammaproteobacteria bacterium]|nr:hypothetical protein [Gammaproteobacteria bacterium]